MKRRIRIFTAMSPRGWDSRGWGFEDGDEDPKETEAAVRDGWARGEEAVGQPVRYRWITVELDAPEPAEAMDIEAEVEP